MDVTRTMKRFVGIKILVLSCALLPGSFALAQTPKSYTDYRNQTIVLPLGKMSFIDRVVSQEPGSKKPKKTERNAQNALGEPDYKKSGDGRAYTLGCRGRATFEFVDNALVDVPGIDLYIFEVGKGIEPTHIDLSKDGKKWISIGRIGGGRAGIDLADYKLAGQDFRFVRVTDLGKSCSGRWPGADIDAIAAVGSAIRFQLSGKVLFDFDKSELKPDAHGDLQALIAKLDLLAVAGIRVVGHTDSKGSDAYNQKLSERRAQSVAAFLRGQRKRLARLIESAGLGEKEPVADNKTKEGRAANRRVEVIVVQK